LFHPTEELGIQENKCDFPCHMRAIPEDCVIGREMGCCHQQEGPELPGKQKQVLTISSKILIIISY
jgi:hypothetical protein